MRFSLATIATFTSIVYGFPRAEPKGHQYIPAGPGDVRSPCPGLNSLANHGFINRNGKNITVSQAQAGLLAGLGVGPDFAQAIGGAAVLAQGSDPPSTFSLSSIREHNFPIEHDASLSRQDYYFGNDYKFNKANFDMFFSHYNGMKKTSIDVASKAKYSRVKDSKKRNPTFTYGPREFILSYGETALYIQTMGMSPLPQTSAPLDYVKILFTEERLPYKEGWSPSKIPISLASLAVMANELFNANPEKAPEGVQITEGTFKDAFEGIDPITGLLGNATQALPGRV